MDEDFLRGRKPAVADKSIPTRWSVRRIITEPIPELEYAIMCVSDFGVWTDRAYCFHEEDAWYIVDLLNITQERTVSAHEEIVKRLQVLGNFLFNSLQWAMEGRDIPEDIADVIAAWEEVQND